jgi:hypothetical protein
MTLVRLGREMIETIWAMPNCVAGVAQALERDPIENRIAKRQFVPFADRLDEYLPADVDPDAAALRYEDARSVEGIAFPGFDPDIGVGVCGACAGDFIMSRAACRWAAGPIPVWFNRHCASSPRCKRTCVSAPHHMPITKITTPATIASATPAPM